MSLQKTLTSLRILYPIWMLTGMFGIMYIPSKLLVANNLTLSAQNILANDLVFRAGIAASLLTQLIYICAAVLLYHFFKHIHKTQATLMLIFTLVGVPIAMLNELNHLAVLKTLNNSELLELFLYLHKMGVVIAAIFWGLWLFPLGYLVYKSGYFPKILGPIVIIGGIGYLAGSFIKILFPAAENIINGCEIMTFGEVIFLAWLVFLGAKIPKDNS